MAKTYVEEVKQGRFLTLEEFQSYAYYHRNLKPIYPNEDCWAPVIGKYDDKDWVQLGSGEDND